VVKIATYAKPETVWQHKKSMNKMNLTIYCFLCCLAAPLSLKGQKLLKSMYKTENDTIVGIQIFDKEGNLRFDRTTQTIYG
jgi:hypothetical protein